MVGVFLKTKGPSLLTLRRQSEAEFLISSARFFQSCLAQYALPFKPGFLVLGFGD